MSTQTDARIASLANESQQQGHPITLADVDDQLRSLQHHQLPSVSSQQYYGQQYYPYIPENQLDAETRADGGSGSQKRARTPSSPDMVKKCSRCRVKRLNEDPEMLVRYQTCVNCRNKRKVKEKKVRSLSKLPNLSDDWAQYQHKVSLNTQIDLYQHNYRNYTDKELFPRYRREELTEEIVKEMSELVVNHYIAPLQMLTGFKFAIRQVPAAEEPEREQAAGGEQAENGGVRLQDHSQLRPGDRRGAAELQPQASLAAELQEGRIRGAAVPAGRRAEQAEIPRAAAQGERCERAEQAAEAGATGHERDRRAGDARRTDRRGQPAGPGTAVRHCAAAAAPTAAIPPVPGRRERGRDAAVN
ncbi:hypothetical protein KL925_000072 [Ogataea polymorpha]|nr:hypothetical protein KL937_003972 [Ogataea polymorpha]KAG7890255.1 hypothetical protein KL908_004593 [Ogataea polymorpha]KAG7895362.1 hypothetical protein KL936_000070 [Ogataea polymorpha]KAG7898585.1 hypothetical protein KL935_004184 [Ogataea polymorpha]KAG7901552.1 hypothetical protein KL907_004222 [Ogataea polymorpha]